MDPFNLNEIFGEASNYSMLCPQKIASLHLQYLLQKFSIWVFEKNRRIFLLKLKFCKIFALYLNKIRLKACCNSILQSQKIWYSQLINFLRKYFLFHSSIKLKYTLRQVSLVFFFSAKILLFLENLVIKNYYLH